MSTKFFNNTTTTLFDKFEGIASDMAGFARFYAVVGYFRASGWFKLRPLLENVPQIKILVGINIDASSARAYQTAMFVGERYRDDFMTEFSHMLTDDVHEARYEADVEQGIRQFVDDIRSGRVQLRIHTSRNLHAKFYLCLPDEHTPNSDGWVIMGSSNLSEQGLGTTQPPRYELNVAMKDYDDVHFCNEEFNQLWEDGVQVTPDDIDKALQNTHISEDGVVTPFEIYMRVLIDRLGGLVEDSYVPKLPKGYADLTYQRDAVAQGYSLMLRHNGCFIADVVGLGKTVVAAMIAQRFVRDNGEKSRILVVFPPAVQSNWERTFADFDLKDYSRFVSSGSLDKVIDASNNLLPKARYDMVIVDESHNFRNEGNNNFGYLQEICKAKRSHPGMIGGPKKVLLLSATPLNNSPEDLRSQIRLFQDDRHCTIDGISDLQATFAPWIKSYKDMQKNRGTWDTARLTATADYINNEIRHTLLEKIMVRRTRSNIKNEPRYCHEIAFPELLEPEEHIYQMSPKVAELFLNTHRLLIDTPEAKETGKSPASFKGDGLHYARYRAVEHCRAYAERSGKNSTELHNTGDQLAGIYQTHMVKRLESSFLAFKKSLHTLRDSTKGMIKMFEDDKVIICPELNVKKLQADGKELDTIIELALKKGFEHDEIVYCANDFDPVFIEQLNHDLKILNDLCKKWDAVKEDPKLDLFVELLQNDLFDKQKNNEGKLVVFSESVDTVNYLTGELKRRLGRNDILDVCAANRNKRRQTIAENFDANYSGEKRNDYNIIITSDVLAEGINLHRANVVANYDSPWNATRLMQRIGRVNRVGSTANAIHNIMFYPSKQGDEIINLKSNTLIKMQSFHSALGEDTQIYSHEEIVHEFRLYDPKVKDETDETNQLLAEVRRLHDENPALYQRIKWLPDKCRVARSAAVMPDGAPSPTPYTMAYISAEGKQAVCLVGNDGTVRELPFLEAARLLKAEPSERPLPFGDQADTHYAHLAKALEFYCLLSDTQTARSVSRPSNSDQEANRAKKLLREIGAQCNNDAVRRHAAALRELVDLGRYSQLTSEFASISRKKQRPSMAELAMKVEEHYSRYVTETEALSANDTESAPSRTGRDAENPAATTDSTKQKLQSIQLILSETIIG